MSASAPSQALPDAFASTGGRPTKISIRGLTKSYALEHGSFKAIDAFDLAIGDAEFLCILGPSGCGKSTLLRILAGLEIPSAGEIIIAAGQRERPLRSMIFQEASVFPWMTVRDNVAFGLRIRHVSRQQQTQTVDHFLRLCGLAAFADAYPHQLSGGMKQRVSVARAFANDPEILLMDEPFAALDEQTKISLQQELLRLWNDTRKTVVFITHSIDEALVLADRVIVMSGRPGRPIADFPVTFPRPRLVHELKSDLEYGRLWHRAWALLGQPAAPVFNAGA
jgi:NitT/TauT family transport system ATP-binding protein